MVFLAKVLKSMPYDAADVTDDGSRPPPKTAVKRGAKTASLHWLVKRMCKEARLEASLSAKLTIKVRRVRPTARRCVGLSLCVQ